MGKLGLLWLKGAVLDIPENRERKGDSSYYLSKGNCSLSPRANKKKRSVAESMHLTPTKGLRQFA